MRRRWKVRYLIRLCSDELLWLVTMMFRIPSSVVRLLRAAGVDEDRVNGSQTAGLKVERSVRNQWELKRPHALAENDCCTAEHWHVDSETLQDHTSATGCGAGAEAELPQKKRWRLRRRRAIDEIFEIWRRGRPSASWTGAVKMENRKYVSNTCTCC